MNYLILAACNQYAVSVYGPGHDLKQAVNDAHSVDDLIPDEGWLRIRLYDRDCTINEFEAQLNYVAENIQEGEICYIVYSGHGTFLQQGRKRATGRCLYNGVYWDHRFAKSLEKFPAGCLVFTMSDTCFSESNSRNVAAPPEDGSYRKAKSMGLARSLPDDTDAVATTNRATLKAAVIHLSACTVNQVAYETSSGGLFTQSLRYVRYMKKDITIGQLAHAITTHLKMWKDMPQKPVCWANQPGKSKKPIIFSTK